MARQQERKATMVVQNVAAALDRVRTHSSQINVDHGTIATHIENLEEDVERLQRELAAEKAAHESEVKSLKEQHAKAIEQLEENFQLKHEKLLKVKAIIDSTDSKVR